MSDVITESIDIEEDAFTLFDNLFNDATCIGETLELRYKLLAQIVPKVAAVGVGASIQKTRIQRL